MDGFFEKYGRMIIVAVAICFVLLLFTPMKNKIGDNINGFVGNFANQTNKNLNEVRMPDELGTGDMINIDDNEYVVLEKHSSNMYLVIASNGVDKKEYKAGPNAKNSNTYENGNIDNYLENVWYKGLSTKMQNAIQISNIKQASYSGYRWVESKQDTGYGGEEYNTLKRHAFLPSVSDVGKMVNLNDDSKVNLFLNGENIWTRDASQATPGLGIVIANNGSRTCFSDLTYKHSVRPTFVIDISQVDYTEVGHVNYK